MAYCPNCGNENPAEARFCASCGQQFGAPEAQPQYAVTTRPGPQFTTSSPQQATGWQLPPSTWPGQRIGLPQYGPNSLADPGQRFLARLLDLLVLVVAAAAVIAIAFAATIAGPPGSEPNPVASFLPLVLLVSVAIYEVAMTAVRGQTLGKMVIGIKVVKSYSGEIPGWGPAFARWVVPAVMGFVPFLPLLDYLWLLWDENRQCLHDKAASTLVVRAR